MLASIVLIQAVEANTQTLPSPSFSLPSTGLEPLDMTALDQATGALDWSAIGREARDTAVGFGAIAGTGGAVVGGITGGIPGALAGGAVGAGGGAAWGALVGGGREFTRQMGWDQSSPAKNNSD